jgi:hypothetical protein
MGQYLSINSALVTFIFVTSILVRSSAVVIDEADDWRGWISRRIFSPYVNAHLSTDELPREFELPSFDSVSMLSKNGRVEKMKKLRSTIKVNLTS